MGGEGSMMAANQSLKANRALKNKRKKAGFSWVSSSKEKWVDHKTASPELLEEIRLKMLKQQRVSKRRMIVAWVVVLCFIVGGLVYVINIKV